MGLNADEQRAWLALERQAVDTIKSRLYRSDGFLSYRVVPDEEWVERAKEMRDALTAALNDLETAAQRLSK